MRTGCAVALVGALIAGCSKAEKSAIGTATASTSTTTTTATSTSTSTRASGTAAVASAAPVSGKGPERPVNVLLITIDSMRADMPWQGYPREIAPNLTAFAKECAVYTHAYAVSSYTAKSLPALLAGRYPSTLYRNWSFFAEYSLANTFFPELLHDKGVRTMAGHAHFYFDHGKHLEQGFDVWRMVPGLKINNSTDESITGDKLADIGIDMLGAPENTKGPFFAWLHFMDPHDAYKQHPEAPKFGRDTRDHYDNEIYYADLQVKRVLDFASKQPWWDKTAVIVSADHGEAFGEHKMYRHAFALWEVLVRVPLMIKAPGVVPRAIDARRSDIDLAPTIVDLLGLPPYPEFAGKTLVPELYGLEPPGDREPIALDLPPDSNNNMTRAIVKGNLKLIVDGRGDRYSLYDLSADPGENDNLALEPKHRAELDDMKKRFEETWAKIPYLAPWGPGKMTGGEKANGPMGPPGYKP